MAKAFLPRAAEPQSRYPQQPLAPRAKFAPRGFRSISRLPCASPAPRRRRANLGSPVQGELDFCSEGAKRLRGCMESVCAVFQRLRPLPFRGGAAAAAEGVVIYRLPYRAALSVRKSFRAVRIAERNRYTANTPPRDPVGDGGRMETAFLLVTKEKG